MPTRAPLTLLSALCFFAVAPSAPASANARHFTYTYETATLPAGAAEFEPWFTVRGGREQYYLRFDHRLEWEMGLTDRLQTAFYLNFTGLAAGPGNARELEFEYGGMSSEWKWKLSDPVADGVGFALYGEAGLAPAEVEFELKALFDKQIGRTILAANLVAELEFEAEGAKWEEEWVGEVTLAAAHELAPGVHVGLEARAHAEVAKEEAEEGAAAPDDEEAGLALEHVALFAGPSLSYSTETYWLALTALAQFAALGGHADGGPDLHEHEYFNGRLLLGFHL